MARARRRLASIVARGMLILGMLLTSANASAEVDQPVREPAIQRVSIAVSDVDRSLTLYSGVLGLEVARMIEHASGRIQEDESANAAPRREALLSAGSTPGQTISLLESNQETSSAAGSAPTLWLEVYNYAQIVAEAEALGLEVSPERQLENLDTQPVRERQIIDWDGNVIVVYRLESAELLGGETVAFGETRRWYAFDDRHVYVQGTEADASFLVTTRSRCRNVLRDARRIEVASRDGSLCMDGARLSFMSGSLSYNCRLDRIEAVPTCTEAERRAAERKPEWRPLTASTAQVCPWEAEAEEQESSTEEDVQ